MSLDKGICVTLANQCLVAKSSLGENHSAAKINRSLEKILGKKVYIKSNRFKNRNLSVEDQQGVAGSWNPTYKNVSLQSKRP